MPPRRSLPESVALAHARRSLHSFLRDQLLLLLHNNHDFLHAPGHRPANPFGRCQPRLAWEKKLSLKSFFGSRESFPHHSGGQQPSSYRQRAPPALTTRSVSQNQPMVKTHQKRMQTKLGFGQKALSWQFASEFLSARIFHCLPIIAGSFLSSCVKL